MSFSDEEDELLQAEMLELAENMGVDIGFGNEGADNGPDNQLPEEGEICDDSPFTLSASSSSIKHSNTSTNITAPKKKRIKKGKEISDDAESLLRAERRLQEQAEYDKERRNQRKRATLHLPPTKPKVPCKYWMEGRCSKGSSCTYSHALRPNKTFSEARLEGEVCRFHIQGTCLKGDSCLYSHDLSQVPCKFYHIHGSCTKSPCKYSHAPFKGEDERRLFFANVMKDTIGSSTLQDPRLMVDEYSGGGSGDINNNTNESSFSFTLYSSEEACLARKDITDHRDFAYVFKASDCQLQKPNKDPR